MIQRQLVLIDTEEEVSHIKNNLSKFKNYSFYVTNLGFHEYLEKNKIKSSYLSEILIQSEWEAINSWAQETALTWFSDPGVRGLLEIEEINIGDSCFHKVAYQLAWYLKGYYFLNDVIQESKTSKAALFLGDTESYNQIFRSLLDETGISYDIILIPQVKKKTNSLRDGIRNILNRLSKKFLSLPAEVDLVFSGGLNHFSTLLKQLKNKQVAIYSPIFQLEESKFCKKYGIHYVPSGLLETGVLKRKVEDETRQMDLNLDLLAEKLEVSEAFHFEGKNIPGLIQSVLSEVKKYSKTVIKQKCFFQSFTEQVRAEQLILDEDRSYRRVMAQVWDKTGKVSFTISHGLPATIFDIRKKITNAGISQCLVNSEYEKGRYEARGFSAEKIHVTGVPRFDGAQVYEKKGVEEDCPTILYCPQRIQKKVKGFLGLHSFLSGEETMRQARDVMRAVRGIQGKLSVKLHYNQGKEELLSLAKEERLSSITVYDHDVNLYRLMAKSNLVVCGFSTVVLESMIQKLPVIILAGKGVADPHPFQDYGVAKVFRTDKDLDYWMRELSTPGGKREEMIERQKESFEFFCGKQEGTNVQRVLEFILNFKNSLQMSQMGSV